MRTCGAWGRTPAGEIRCIQPAGAFWLRSWIRLLAGIVMVGAGGVMAQEAVKTVAGQVQQPGYRDGEAGPSRFSDPAGLATDVAGNIYIADSGNHCVRRLGIDGLVSTLVGRVGEAGTADGTATHARLDGPSAVAWSPDGSLYISDTGNHTIRRFYRGQLSTFAGVAGDPGPTNGPARLARLNSPLGLVVSGTGEVVVADAGNHAIRKIGPTGEVSTIAGEPGEWGAVDGVRSAARFNGPVGVAQVRNGDLIIADSLNHALRKVTSGGVVTTLAGKLGEPGCVDGPGADARFCNPAELQLDAHGRLYVVDAFNHVVRAMATNGMVATIAGRLGDSGAADGENGTARFFNPYGLVVRPGGSVMVADTYNGTLRELLPPFEQAIERSGGILQMRWESVVGMRYQVMAEYDTDGKWQPVSPAASAIGPVSEWVTPLDPGRAGAVLYRIKRN